MNLPKILAGTVAGVALTALVLAGVQIPAGSYGKVFGPNGNQIGEFRATADGGSVIYKRAHDGKEIEWQWREDLGGIYKRIGPLWPALYEVDPDEPLEMEIFPQPGGNYSYIIRNSLSGDTKEVGLMVPEGNDPPGYPHQPPIPLP